jgi:galactose oxidase
MWTLRPVLVRFSCAGALLLFGALFAPGSIAQVKTGYSSIVASHSGKCLDVYGADTMSGARVIQYTCHADDNQLWTLQPFGGGYRVVVKHSGQCLSVENDSAQADAAIVQYPCGSSGNQLWNLRAVGDALQLVSRKTSMCLVVRNNALQDEGALVQQTCSGQQNVLWQFDAGVVLPTTPAALAVRHSGQCLTIDGPTTVAGSIAVQASCNGTAAQKWSLVLSGDAYRIRLTDSGLCLGVADASQQPVAPVVQLACNGASNTLWTLQASNGYYNIVAKHSGQCLDINNNSLDEGATAIQYPCSAGNNQRWILAAPTSASAWTPLIDFPIVPVAAANLPNGKVLTWSAYSPINFVSDNPNGTTYTAIFDPATQSCQERIVSETGHDMFCPGTSMLPDGRLLVNGGSTSQKTSIFDSSTNTWTTEAVMNIPRGYQGNTVLFDGSVLTLGGSWSGGQGGKGGEIWTPEGGWRLMPGIPVDPFLGPDPGGMFRADNHLWLFSFGNGIVLHAGPSAAMHWIDTGENGSVTSAGTRGDDAYSMNGNAVMFDVGKILKVGGAPAYEEVWTSPASYLIEVGATLTTRKIAPMNYARAMHNSTVLPNGQVVITGGQSYVKIFSDERSVLMTELWDPKSEVFTKLRPVQIPRNYHSFSLLLPDGRVLVGGGGLCGDCATNHLNAEILTPPYLLNKNGTPATRPAILTAPASATYGDAIAVTTNSPIVSFALMRFSSVTHSVNNDQRRIPLNAWSDDARSYTLEIPNDPGALTPGYYMLFALNAKGVPSVSKALQIR